MGRPDLCELLAGLGARREVGPIDELIGLCFAGDRDGRAAAGAREHPERAERRPRASSSRRCTRRPRRAARPPSRSCSSSASSIDLPGQMGGTPLHHAAWWGHGDVVALLLARGADPQRRAEPGIGGTALGWAAHGSFHSPGPVAGGGTDHLRIAERLVAAGAKVEPDMAHEAAGELAEWLAERGRRERPTPSAAAGAACRAGLRRARARGSRRVPCARCPASGSSSGTGSRSAPASTPTADNGVVCSAGVDDDRDRRDDRAGSGGAPAQWLDRAPDCELGAAARRRRLPGGAHRRRDGRAAIERPPGRRAAAGRAWRSSTRTVPAGSPWRQASSLFEDAQREADLLDAVAGSDAAGRATRRARRSGSPARSSHERHRGRAPVPRRAPRPSAAAASGARCTRGAARAPRPAAARGARPGARRRSPFHRRVGFELQPALRDRVLPAR